jgi:streptogramin lyase
MRKLLFIFLIIGGCSKAPTYTPIILADAGHHTPTPDIINLPKDVIQDTTSLPVDSTGTVDALGPPPDIDVQFIDAGGIDTILPDPPKKDTSSGPPIGGPDTKGGLPDTGMWQTCVDKDGDGYGLGCYKGGDCDDNNPNFATICPDCSKQNWEGCPCKSTAANCYSGEPQWIGKGICQAGVQLCKSGYWGMCTGEKLPQPESCDSKDNNCNGLIDEGVLSSCGTCDLSCIKQEIGPDFGKPFDTNGKKGLKINANGYIELDIGKTSTNLNHIWIANSSENTVSKLNTKTGVEEGRYSICSNPSRTSVDLNGDCWVGCRGDGSVAKIRVNKKDCVDKNGNGNIETSSGKNIVSNDECIQFIVNPDGKTVARAAGVDKDNHAWIGFWNSKRLRRLEPNAGQSVDQINIGCNPYGLVIDQKGIIWIAGRGCSALLRVDPKTKSVQNVGKGGGSPYGINVDMFGRIWVADTTTSSSRYDPITKQWAVVKHNNRSRGIATSNDGHVYVALDQTSSVAKINVVTLTVMQHISLGSGRYPVGIAVDYDGYVWAVNQSKSSATKIDPTKNSVVGEYSVGKGPYTYSDMTGYTLHNYTAPKGDFQHTFGYGGWGGTVAETKTTTEWEQIDVDFTLPEDSFIDLRYRVADDLKLMETTQWSKKIGPFPPNKFPYKLQGVKGRFLQVEVFMQASKNKLSPIIKSLSAKGKTIVLK